MLWAGLVIEDGLALVWPANLKLFELGVSLIGG